jgi:hypothetical protein
MKVAHQFETVQPYGSVESPTLVRRPKSAGSGNVLVITVRFSLWLDATTLPVQSIVDALGVSQAYASQLCRGLVKLLTY